MNVRSPFSFSFELFEIGALWHKSKRGAPFCRRKFVCSLHEVARLQISTQNRTEQSQRKVKQISAMKVKHWKRPQEWSIVRVVVRVWPFHQLYFARSIYIATRSWMCCRRRHRIPSSKLRPRPKIAPIPLISPSHLVALSLLPSKNRTFPNMKEDRLFMISLKTGRLSLGGHC